MATVDESEVFSRTKFGLRDLFREQLFTKTKPPYEISQTHHSFHRSKNDPVGADGHSMYMILWYDEIQKVNLFRSMNPVMISAQHCSRQQLWNIILKCQKCKVGPCNNFHLFSYLNLDTKLYQSLVLLSQPVCWVEKFITGMRFGWFFVKCSKA